jgi:hypothetical protein
MKLLITIVSIIVSYYVGIILHEWGHGTVAWLFDYKSSPFSVDYGGWLLTNVDENVPYNQILAAGHGVKAALIGIAGVTVSTILFLLSWVVLKKIKSNSLMYTFFYWFGVINIVPIFQYFTVETFAVEGDVGRFTHGLNISPWWVFVPGTIFAFVALYQFFRHLVPKAYAILPIHSLWVQRVFLFASLFSIFVWIYLHKHNPLSDQGTPLMGKVLAIFSFFLVPILFFICEPSRPWVKREISFYNRMK